MEPYYALPFPSFEAAMEASLIVPDSIVQEIDGAWLLLVPAGEHVEVGVEDE